MKGRPERPSPELRLATVADAELVQTISAAAYVPAYLPVIGAVPRPATEDYTGFILRESVWIAALDGEACGVLVHEDGAGFLMIWSVAVHAISAGAWRARCWRTQSPVPQPRGFPNSACTPTSG